MFKFRFINLISSHNWLFQISKGISLPICKDVTL